MSAALYHGAVMHRRLRPVGHRFVYRVFSMMVDLDALDALDRDMRWFSRNRINLFSFHDRDHGDGKSDLPVHIRRVLADAGVDAPGRIDLLCYPRILGYVFNPLSVYYCHDASGALAAVLYEVNNTFGGRHTYLAAVESDASVVRQTARKLFHVSPFMPMETDYHFRLNPPGDGLSVLINQTDDAGPVFKAAFVGAREEMTDAALRRAFFRYPLMTVKVIVGIHWEALKLFAKGMRLLPGAPDPENAVTVLRDVKPKQRRAA
ncbi:MAG: DUF1365 domain-containing protein [Pseudomonadota bacterium]